MKVSSSLEGEDDDETYVCHYCKQGLEAYLAQSNLVNDQQLLATESELLGSLLLWRYFSLNSVLTQLSGDPFLFIYCLQARLFIFLYHHVMFVFYPKA